MMLCAENLETGYGSMQILWGLNLAVEKGSITALLGPNGAGKTTTLRAILGTVRAWRGRIFYNGQDVTTQPSHKRVAQGLVLVPEGRHLFPTMTVRENLLMGAYLPEARAHIKESLELAYELFPILKERSEQRAGTLSGGEQQMLAIARGLMAQPKLLMLDEPSQGLAPQARRRSVYGHRPAARGTGAHHPARRTKRRAHVGDLRLRLHPPRGKS